MKSEPDNAYELSELCEHAGVTPRTVRYYVQQGLLPAPGMGPGTKYGQGHLDRLRLIRRLQRDHLPLAEIRKRLGRLDDAQVAAALQRADEEAPGAVAVVFRRPDSPYQSAESAADYVAGVLGTPGPGRVDAPAGGRRSQPRSAPYERDRWDRYRLTEDVEIHVRRPLSREANRRVERLIAAARDILGEEP